MQKQSIIPSVVGIGSTNYGLLETRRNQRGKPHVVAFNGATYLVGEGVERYSRVVERMDLLRLGDSQEARALTYATLGTLLGEGYHTISATVGFPVELMIDRDKARATLRTLQKWMVGEHSFDINGDAVTVNVLKINAASQPSGTYAAWALNDDGKSVLTEQDKRATVAICDPGFNTLDLQVIGPGGRLVGTHTGGETLGMRRAAEVLQELLERRGVRLSLHQCDDLIRNNTQEVETMGGFDNVGAEVAQARSRAESGIIAYLTRKWETLSASRILFTGGGSEAMKAALLQQYPTGRVLQNAVTANALGLARLARANYEGPVIGLDPGFGSFKGVLIY